MNTDNLHDILDETVQVYSQKNKADPKPRPKSAHTSTRCSTACAKPQKHKTRPTSLSAKDSRPR
ncbi:twitching motility - like protein [Neisseria gonorrhoeae]|uniref:Twitching motility - like protein n=1 Tax=Neisseria gonorrhoeae TaxID=485 RepID=A0A378W245_NEIGO|nr:twitching motility - like protein [Neisseria gonorrhoeae]